jgi:hypothetical protein
VRTAAVLFDDVAWPRLIPLPLERLSELFDATMTNPEVSELNKLLGLARIFALHFGPGAASSVQIPVSWFVNLETLFEDAFMTVLRQAAPRALPNFLFREGRTFGRTVITSPSSYEARPDVVGCHGDAFPLIMDTKYKDLEKEPHQGDLYQLMAHMAAFGARVGVLIYPSERYDLRFLGRAGGESKIYVALCGLARLQDDVQILLQELNAKEGLAGIPPVPSAR